MSCENCLNRRQFLVTSGIGVLATAVAACGDGSLGVPGTNVPIIKVPPPPAGPLTLKVGDYPQLASVNVLVQVAGTFFAVKRTGAATFEAFSMACTHEGFQVGIVNGNRFDCPAHGSRFDINGNVLLGPATIPLQKRPTSYDPASDLLTIS